MEEGGSRSSQRRRPRIAVSEREGEWYVEYEEVRKRRRRRRRRRREGSRTNE